MATRLYGYQDFEIPLQQNLRSSARHRRLLPRNGFVIQLTEAGSPAWQS